MNNTLERTNLKLVGEDLVSKVCEDSTNAEIIRHFKLVTETFCKKQDKVPGAIGKVVHEKVQNRFLGKKAQVNYIAASFSLFFEIIKNKETKFALQCLNLLNSEMSIQVSRILIRFQDLPKSWTILQLILSAGTDVFVPESLPKTSFLNTVASSKKYIDSFDEELCEKLDMLFFTGSNPFSSFVDELTLNIFTL